MIKLGDEIEIDNTFLDEQVLAASQDLIPLFADFQLFGEWSSSRRYVVSAAKVVHAWGEKVLLGWSIPSLGLGWWNYSKMYS